MAFMNQITRRGLATSVQRAAKIEEFVVIGGGLMGAGIAQVGAQTGHKVTLVDVSQDVLDKSQARINESIKRVAKKKFKEDPTGGEKFISEAVGRLSIATKADDVLKTADLVVEAVTENLELKRKLFSSFDEHAPEHTIFASNTSSLPISEIAKATPNRIDRFGGLHFFNPLLVPNLMESIRMVERGDATAPDVDTAMKLGA